jgi:hypothetical protein
MPAIGLRQAATILGVAAGVLELVLAALILKDGPKAFDYTGLFIYIVPLVMIAGAVAITYVRETFVGAGIVVVTFAIQHTLAHLQTIHLIPMALATAAVVLAMRVDVDLRAEAAAAER